MLRFGVANFSQRNVDIIEKLLELTFYWVIKITKCFSYFITNFITIDYYRIMNKDSLYLDDYKLKDSLSPLTHTHAHTLPSLHSS